MPVRAPSRDIESNAYYGPYIRQGVAEELAKGYLSLALKDPYSAHYRFGTVKRGWLQSGALYGCKLNFGYILDVGVNAKNSFGAYTGEKLYSFLFRDGNLVDVLHPDNRRRY